MSDQIIPTTEKAPSALASLLKSLEGAKKPNASDVKAITNKFKTSMGQRAKLEKALKEFDDTSDATAVEMVKCFGTQQVEIGGVIYIPTSRGVRVYYKKMSGDRNVVKLDD